MHANFGIANLLSSFIVRYCLSYWHQCIWLSGAEEEPGVIENPQIVVSANSGLTISDRRHHHPMGHWKFWGGILVGLAIISIIVFPEQRGTNPAELMLPLLTATVGSILMVASGKASVKQVPLANLHLASKRR